MTQTRLKLNTITRAMDLRADHYKNTRGEIVSCRDWSAADDFTALIGEIGEAANIVKKIRRGDFTLDEARPMLAKELADVQCYICRFADRQGVDLDVAAADAFNTTVNHASASAYQWVDLSDLMTMLGEMAGWLASLVMNASFEKNSIRLGTEVPASMADSLGYLQRRLILTASFAGIDLAAATIDKFNEVSVRVGSPVRVDQDGVYTMPTVKGNTETAAPVACDARARAEYDSVGGSDF